MTEPTPLLNLAGAADMLGVSERKVWQMVTDGDLPGFKMGRQWRFVARQIEEWAIAQTQKSSPPSVAADAGNESIANPSLAEGGDDDC